MFTRQSSNYCMPLRPTDKGIVSFPESNPKMGHRSTSFNISSNKQTLESAFTCSDPKYIHNLDPRCGTPNTPYVQIPLRKQADNQSTASQSQTACGIPLGKARLISTESAVKTIP